MAPDHGAAGIDAGSVAGADIGGAAVLVQDRVLFACGPTDIGRYGASFVDRGSVAVGAAPRAQVNDGAGEIDGGAHASRGGIQRACHLAGVVDVGRIEVGRQLVH